MSDREVRQKLVDEKFPVTDKRPMLDENYQTYLASKWGVSSWSPYVTEGPAEAVVLILEVPVGMVELRVGLKLPTVEKLDLLIAALERHRDQVWPKEGADAAAT